MQRKHQIWKTDNMETDVVLLNYSIGFHWLFSSDLRVNNEKQ